MLKHGDACPSDDRRPDESVATDNARWVDALSGSGPEFEDAASTLYVTLVKMGYAEARWRAGALRLSGEEVDDIAHQAAADAVMVICRKLSTFRGDSRFTTWAYRFVIFDVRSKLNRHMWRRPTVSLSDDGGDPAVSANEDPETLLLACDLQRAVHRLIRESLTERQRVAFEAIVIQGLSVAQVAEELDSNPNAIYKTVFDARKKLREGLRANGYCPE